MRAHPGSARRLALPGPLARIKSARMSSEWCRRYGTSCRLTRGSDRGVRYRARRRGSRHCGRAREGAGDGLRSTHRHRRKKNGIAPWSDAIPFFFQPLPAMGLPSAARHPVSPLRAASLAFARSARSPRKRSITRASGAARSDQVPSPASIMEVRWKRTRVRYAGDGT